MLMRDVVKIFRLLCGRKLRSWFSALSRSSALASLLPSMLTCFAADRALLIHAHDRDDVHVHLTPMLYQLPADAHAEPVSIAQTATSTVNVVHASGAVDRCPSTPVHSTRAIIICGSDLHVNQQNMVRMPGSTPALATLAMLMGTPEPAAVFLERSQRRAPGERSLICFAVATSVQMLE